MSDVVYLSEDQIDIGNWEKVYDQAIDKKRLEYVFKYIDQGDYDRARYWAYQIETGAYPGEGFLKEFEMFVQECQEAKPEERDNFLFPKGKKIQ
jgi:hypothetical protein